MSSIRNEQYCENLFHSEGPFWHLCTSGLCQSIIFTNKEDYCFGINSLAISLAEEPKVTLWAFAIMSNHIHEIISGSREACLAYFNNRKKKLIRYYSKKDNTINWDDFSPKLIDINTLEQLRIEIIYVHRNGYVANPNVTPYSYPWSSSIFFFNDLQKMNNGYSYDSLTYNEKRKLTHSRAIELPANYFVKDEHFFPPSFCKINNAEQFFRDAHHYFIKLAKPTEEKSLVSSALKETIFLSDEEIYPTVCGHCYSKYGKALPSQLSSSEKLEVASTMHNQYNASNKQINRILRIPIDLLSELFGKL